MRTSGLCLSLSAAVLVFAPLNAAGSERPPYASSAPLREPALFSEAINSIPGAGGLSFTPDGRTVYFTVERPPHGRLPAHNVIVTSRFVAGQWTPPSWLEFSGQNQEGNVTLSPDGSRLFFWSYRSAPELESPPKGESDVYYVERAGTGWSAPRKLAGPVNSGDRDYTGSFSADGTLYFSSKRDTSKGLGDIYVARRSPDGGYPVVENLGEAINTPSEEYGAAVSPDGRTLVFASDRPGGLGMWDLYVSFRSGGAWQPARNLGRRVNSVFQEAQPRFSPDGKYLFFNSERSGKSQIYYLDSDVLREAASDQPHPYASSKPMTEATRFAEGVISTPANGCITFAPDGRMAFFVNIKDKVNTLMLTRFENGRWSAPEPAPFQGGDPMFSPDGKRLFFASTLPIDGRESKSPSIRYVERTANEWTEPKLPSTEPVGPVGWQGSFASTASDGSLYYFSWGPDSQGATDIYRVPFREGRYGKRENLGPEINTRHNEVDPYIAPDQSFLIFSSPRPGGFGNNDLYVSLNRQGRWSAPRNLGPLVNSPKGEVCPSVSPDGRYLFFTSERDGQPGIFQIDIGVLRLAE